MELDPIRLFKTLRHTRERTGLTSYAFYDDALLVNRRRRLFPLLELIAGSLPDVRLHIQNAVHPALLDGETALQLRAAGVRTIRLALETVNEELLRDKMKSKVHRVDLHTSIRHLLDAGFSKSEIGVYVLAGVPGQSIEEVADTISFVQSTGVRIVVVEYSPVPQTPDFTEGFSLSRYDYRVEPLWQNNFLMPYRDRIFTLERYRELRAVASSSVLS